MDGLGSITWWGFSPALDLQDTDCLSALKSLKIHQDAGPEELHILLVGAGDVRHVLTTVARSYRHIKRKLHFYILESSLELYARDLLFLTIALETQKRLGLQDKTELFLELYGNLLVRRQSCEYVERMTNEFIKMVTDFDYLEKTLPLIDLSLLKFKERDFLESIFKFWRNPDTKYFEAEKIWDLRLRKYLGNGYDTRSNVFDWDLNMKLVYRDAEIINTHEYKKWRGEGIAFDMREATYDTPNKTLASGMVFKHEGERHHRRGYWGDIIVSPYVALGIHCEEKSFFKKYNNVFTKMAQDIAQFNVLSMFHEIASGTRYIPPQPESIPETKTQDKEGPSLTEIKEEEDDTNHTKTEEKSLEEFEKEVEADAKQQEVTSETKQQEVTSETKQQEVTSETKQQEVTSETKQQEVTSETKQQEVTSNANMQTETKPLDQEYEALPLTDVKVSFLSIGCLEDLPKKSKFKNRFQMVYFSNSMVHHLKSEINPLFADKAVVLLESARYMLELKLEQVKEFGKKVTGMAEAAGCCPSGSSDFEKDNVFKFTFERTST